MGDLPSIRRQATLQPAWVEPKKPRAHVVDSATIINFIFVPPEQYKGIPFRNPACKKPGLWIHDLIFN
jgi:hypothetical protein